MDKKFKEQAQHALEKALKPHGMKAAVAREVGLSDKAVAKWTVCHEQYLESVEKITGVSRFELRPDLAYLFGPPPSQDTTAAE